MNAIEFAATHELKLVPVGSRVTCVPPPTDTDQDYLVWTNSHTKTCLALAADEWDSLGSGPSDDELSCGIGWCSFRKGEDNIILTWDRGFYDSFLCASAAAAALNLLSKADRISLFQVIMRHWPSDKPDLDPDGDSLPF